MAPSLNEPLQDDDKPGFELLQHGHKDIVQAVAFNGYGDRCASGAVDGKIRVFNRHRDGTWRLCDNWSAHGGEVLELQWLPPTLYPNLLSSLGIDGRFKIWAEDPSAAPGRRFGSRTSGSKAGFETRNNRPAHATSSTGGGGPSSSTMAPPPAPYRSFSMRHSDETRHTWLALLAADGGLTVYENEVPENLADYSQIDEFRVCGRPARGEETAFRVRFDPNPEPCYTALRAGVGPDALGLVVAAMRTAKVYRSRDIVKHGAYGVGPVAAKEFYLAVELDGHGGLVRDVAWAPGNVRGYDVVATACQDGLVRVFRIDTPFDPDDGRSWSEADMTRKRHHEATAAAALAGAAAAEAAATAAARSASGDDPAVAGLTAALGATARPGAPPLQQSGIGHGLAAAAAAAAVAASGGNGLAAGPHQPPESLQVPASAPPGTSSFDLRPTPAGDDVTRPASSALGQGAADAAGMGADGGVQGLAHAGHDGQMQGAHHQQGLAQAAAAPLRGETSPSAPAAHPPLSQQQQQSLPHRPGGHHHPSAAPGHHPQQPALLPGQIRHVATEIARLDGHGSPVWRVGFDDDGRLLASVGDDGRLVTYRQTPRGDWAKSSELGMVRPRPHVG